MAKTYYKYAERNVDSQINWAEVGKNITDMLGEEARLREQKKAEIDEASRKFGEVLSNAPTGEHAGMNQWALDYAADAQEARLIQDRLLRSGQLKLRDYNIMRQNVTDGTKGAFDLVKEYQSEFKDKMERAKTMDPKTRSQYLEQWYMQQAEGFGNFSNSKLYINPTNGQVSVAKKTLNPDTGVYEMSNNPNDFVTVNDMRNRIKSRFDYFDFDGISDQYVDSLGDVSRVFKVPGGYKTITDVTLRNNLSPTQKGAVDEFGKALDAQLNSFLAGNAFNATSILTENIGSINGQMVGFTFDPNEAAKNEHLVLLKQDPANPGGAAIPDFDTPNGKKQYQKVLDFMRQQVVVKLDKKEQFQQGPQMQQWQYQIGQNKKEQANRANMLAKLYSGTDAEVQQAVDYFNGLPGVKNVTRDETGVTLTYSDKDGKDITKKINFKAPNDGPLVGTEGFIQAASGLFLGPDADPKLASQTAIATKGKEFNPNYTGSGTTVTQGTQNVSIVASLPGAIVEDGAEETAKNLNDMFSGTNFTFDFEEDTFGTTDNIIVKQGGQTIGTFAVDDKTNVENIQNLILAKMKSTPTTGTVTKPVTAGAAAGDAIFQ